MTTRLCFRHNVGHEWGPIIARVTGSPVHCGLDIDGRFYQANTPVGVTLSATADNLATGQWTAFTIPDRYDIAAMETFGVEQLGMPYDYLGVLIAWWAPRVFNGSRSKWFCSEFCARGLLVARVALANARPAYYTPARLYRACLAMGWTGEAIQA